MAFRALAGFVLGFALLAAGLGFVAGGLKGPGMERFRNAASVYSGGTVRGILLGTVFTAAIQSSSAATILLVGMVKGGILTVRRAVPLVLGANLGTTLTGQLLARGAIGSGGILPTMVPLIAGGILSLCRLWRGGKGTRSFEWVLYGVGMVFLGLEVLDRGLTPLGRQPWFLDAFMSLGTSPWTGLVAGVVLTAVVMSSSVTVGLLQRFAEQGFVSLTSALFIMAGDDLGTTADTMVVGLFAGSTGRSLAISHLLFNIINMAIVLSFHTFFVHAVQLLGGGPAQQVANAHTLFNLAGVILVAPFCRALADAALRISEFVEKCRPIPLFLRKHF